MSRLEDHSAEIRVKLQEAIRASLLAVGENAVGQVRTQMTEGYETPVYETGNLLEKINAHIDEASNTVTIGTNVEYAKYVHDGHAGHAVYFPDRGEFRVVPGGYTPGRPFLTDTFQKRENLERLKDIIADNINRKMSE